MHSSLLRQGRPADTLSVYRFVQAEKANHSVRTLCRVMRVARAGYYAWRRRRPSLREQEDDELQERIEAIHRASGETYGAPRIHAELRLEHGIRVSRKRVARLMRRAGLQGEHRRRRGRSKAMRASLEARVAPDRVQRGFDVEDLNAVWFADVKQAWTSEGWLYLAAVLDAASKRIVGWSMSDAPTTDLVVNAVSMAAATRQPDWRSTVARHSLGSGCVWGGVLPVDRLATADSS